MDEKQLAQEIVKEMKNQQMLTPQNSAYVRDVKPDREIVVELKGSEQTSELLKMAKEQVKEMNGGN